MKLALMVLVCLAPIAGDCRGPHTTQQFCALNGNPELKNAVDGLLQAARSVKLILQREKEAESAEVAQRRNSGRHEVMRAVIWGHGANPGVLFLGRLKPLRLRPTPRRIPTTATSNAGAAVVGGRRASRQISNRLEGQVRRRPCRSLCDVRRRSTRRRVTPGGTLPQLQARGRCAAFPGRVKLQQPYSFHEVPQPQYLQRRRSAPADACVMRVVPAAESKARSFRPKALTSTGRRPVPASSVEVDLRARQALLRLARVIHSDRPGEVTRRACLF